MLMLATLFVMKAVAQEVEETQRTLVTKRSATWCPPCGSWGWDLFEDLLGDNGEGKAVIIAAHYSGLLATTEADEITSNFGAFSQPRFFVDEVDINATSSNYQTKKTTIEGMVNTAYNSAPVANVGFAPVFENSAIKVDAKVKFFQAAEGEFYLGIYLIESGIVEYQASIGDNAVHEKVMRGGFSDNTWGQPIANGAVAAGEEFDLSYSLSIGGVQGYDYEVVGIIWQLENGVYKPVNVWSTDNISTTSAVQNVDSVVDFKVVPNVTDNQAVVQLQLDKPQQSATLSLFDINGKEVLRMQSGNFIEGRYDFQLNKEKIGGAGVYFVRFTDGKKVSTRKVVFQ